MYNTISVSPELKWEDISRRVFGLPDRAGEIAKLNNYTNSGTVIVPEDIKTEKPTKEVTLTVNNTTFTNFAEYTLYDGMESIRGAVFCLDNKNCDVKNGDFATVCDSNGLFLNGFVRNIKPNFNAGFNWLQIEVKSSAGVLAESVINKEQLESSNTTLKELITMVLSGFGVSCQFSEISELNEIFVNAIGTGFSADINETAFEFIKRVCNSRNLVVKDTGNGLFIGKITPENTINFIENESIGINWGRAKFNTVGLGRRYEVNTQFPQTATAQALTPVNLPILKRINSADFNGNDGSSAEKIAAKDIGELFSITYGISDNLGLQAGEIATVKDSRLLINAETEFIIENVVRQDNNETVVTLVLPCKYTGIIPKELPACRF